MKLGILWLSVTLLVPFIAVSTPTTTDSCPPNKSWCEEKVECIPTRLFCDGVEHCPDGSDEWDCGDIVECKYLHCSHGCQTTPYGPKCFCPDGQVPDGKLCLDLDECKQENDCEQFCQNTHGSYLCSCAKDYISMNFSRCVAVRDSFNDEMSLLYTTSEVIKRVDLEGKPWKENFKMRLNNSRPLEIDYANRTVCYNYKTANESSIGCSNLDNLTDMWTVPTPGLPFDLDNIKQIKLDWLSGNWYLVDDSLNLIFLCNYNFELCSALTDKDLYEPSITLDPTKGVMFIAHQRHPANIKRCRLDGLQCTTIISENITEPFSITVDIPTSKVCWVDKHINHIACADYDGKNRKNILSGSSQNIQTMVMFENYLYYSQRKNPAIVRISKTNKEPPKFLRRKEAQPHTVQILHRAVQPERPRPCSVNNGGCDSICTTDYLEATKEYGVNCMCQSGYQLTNRTKCVLSNESTFLIFLKESPGMIKAAPIVKNQSYPSMIPFTNINVPNGLEFDYKERYIYFSDYERNIILRQKINSKQREIVRPTGFTGATDSYTALGLDWISRLLYWANDRAKTIQVVMLSDFSKHKTIVHDYDGRIRSLVLHPEKGVMFWSTMSFDSSGTIKTSHMNGKNKTTLVSTELEYPTSLTLDYHSAYLYWCDLWLHKIERIGLDGSNRKTILTQQNDFIFAYSVAFYNGYLFFIDSNADIQRYNINDGSIDEISTNSGKLSELKVFADVQNGINKCTNNNCSDMCLPIPNDSICACPDGYIYVTETKKCKERA